MKTVPQNLKYYSLDEVAECVTGIAEETYADLWRVLSLAKTPKPAGGDGTAGTTEEPIVSCGEYDTDLAAGWKHLTETSRANICAAAQKMEWNPT